MKEISIRDVLEILLHALIWILLTAIIAGCGAWYYYSLLTDEYTAESKLYVLMDYTDATGTLRYDISTSGSFAGDFKELIKTPSVLQGTAKALGMDALPKDASINVSAVSGTRIIVISTTYKDPDFAMRATNELAKVFAAYVRDLTKTDTISVASEAVLPSSPSGPARTKNTAIAALAGAVLAAGAALALAMLNTKATADNFANSDMNVDILAQVPDYRPQMETFIKQSPRDAKPLYRCVSSVAREQVKTLLLNMRFANLDKSPKSIVMASVTLAEGKSSLSVLIASALAEENKRALIVDMDFRKPTIGKYVGKRAKYDLVDYMSGQCPIEKVISGTPIENVSFVDCHHRGAMLSRMVGTEAFDTFLSEVSAQFDLVIFDAPPVGMFMDAALLSTKVSGVVFVVADNRVEMSDVRQSLAQLEKLNANVLGCALNLIRKRSMKHGGYYYNKYKGYKHYYSHNS